jgi:hypothetical protein
MLLLLVVVFGSSRSRPRGRVIVPLMLTTFAALDAVRHIPIFVLLAIPVIAAARTSSIAFGAASDRQPPKFRPLFNGAVVLLLAVFAITRWTGLARKQSALEAEQFPQRAVAFLQTSTQPQRVFAYYDWGGYTIWKLYPAYRVFLDGRADLYGDDLLHQFKVAVQLRGGWLEILDNWKVETVLLPPSCALAQALLLDAHWGVVYNDSKAIVLVRTRRPSQNAVIFRPANAGRDEK